MGYIYQLRNTLNDMIYIGQTIDIKRRMKEYKNKSKKLNIRANSLKNQIFSKESVETNM